MTYCSLLVILAMENSSTTSDSEIVNRSCIFLQMYVLWQRFSRLKRLLIQIQISKPFRLALRGALTPSSLSPFSRLPPQRQILTNTIESLLYLLNLISMIESLVDYVLERGNKDYGEFAPRESRDPTNSLYNHRKLLAYLFQEDQTAQIPSEQKLEKRISQLKLEEISGQLNYFSEKIHAELSKKNLTLDGDLYKLQNEWLRKKMPDFYCYYFLKFAYANSYSRMHELFLSEIENMNREKDSYAIIKKTIEARESCLSNLRRLVHSIKQIEVQESLQTLRQEREAKKRLKVAQEHTGGGFKPKERGEEGGKSWKNQLEVIFENIHHLRKLTAYVVELIKLWRASIYGISDDPRRYRERVIFYHNDANYLLKMLFDSNFLRDSFLKKHLNFSKHFDPFALRPAMHLEKKKPRTENDQIFLELVRPTQLDMDKITKALVILAEEEYDEDQQSRFINDRKNYGELQQRKQFIERRRDALGIKSYKSEKALPNKPLTQREDKDKQGERKQKNQHFSQDKKAVNTQRELQEIKSQKEEAHKKSRVETTLNRLKQMRAVDLKKVSPYLSRNERIQKAQKVIQLEHKFRVAQSDYLQEVKRKKEEQRKESIQKIIETNKETINSKIFNRYIEENLKLMDEATKRAYIYKNQVQVNQQRISSSLNYHKVPFHQRKEAQYERNLQRYYPKQQSPSPSRKGLANTQAKATRGTRAVIEISNKGVRTNQKIIEFQLNGHKGKNVGQILNSRQRQIEKDLTKSKFEPEQRQRQKDKEQIQGNNLFDSEKQPQVLIIRQEPQKLQEIKQFLYVKIKEELMEQMKKNAENKQLELNNMIEEEKRRKLQEIIDERKRQEERKRQQQERLRLARLQRQRKQLSFEVRIQPIQYAEQNLDNFFSSIFEIDPSAYHRLFTTQKVEDLKDFITHQFYYVFLIGYYENEQVAYCVVHYEWQYQLHRKLVIDYLVLKQKHLYMSTLYRMCQFLWKNDPCQEIELVMFKNEENSEGIKILEDVEVYAQKTGQTFEKQIYSNITETRFVWMRPSHHSNQEFTYKNYYFGKLINLKAELLSASLSLNQRYAPKIDMTLEVFTSYIFLLQELFRSYLTPEEVIQLRENSTNIRRLKDILRIVLELEKKNPVVDELLVIEGVNLDDLYAKLKQKKMAPYDKYYWHHFYDKITANRLLLSVLEFKSQLKYPIQSCYLNDRRFIRINCRQKMLILRSSIYSEKNIFVLDTHNPKIKMFITDGQHYKLMRMELFVFLNLVFNNIVEDTQRFINCIWVPQFTVCDGEEGKEVKRITDFSISMKKSFFLSEEIYFANHQFIKSAVSLVPKQADVVFLESVIVGFMHTSVEEASTGMPIYAKLIDKKEMF